MKEKGALLQKIITVFSILLCVVFIPLLLVNVTLIAKSYIHPDQVPDFMGYKPFIVLSGSMEPGIMTGDMVFVKNTDTGNLQKGDVIAYKSGEAVITHRIIDVTTENGEVRYMTQGYCSFFGISSAERCWTGKKCQGPGNWNTSWNGLGLRRVERWNIER